MKVNVAQPILDYTKKEITEADGTVLDYRSVIVGAINNYNPGEQPVAEDKNRAFQISTKLYASKSVDLTPKEMSYIIERSAAIHTPLVYGRICELLGETTTSTEE